MKESVNKQLGEPSIDDAACREWTDGTAPICGSLKEVRKGIDDLDDQIRLLLGKRLALTNDAARFKQNINEVPAPARQREVIARAVDQAIELKDSYPLGYVELVEATSQIIMATCIQLQGRAMTRTRPRT